MGLKWRKIYFQGFYVSGRIPFLALTGLKHQGFVGYRLEDTLASEMLSTVLCLLVLFISSLQHGSIIL
jgi:hypothetical protein